MKPGTVLGAALAAAVALTGKASHASLLGESSTWEDLRPDVLGDAIITDGSSLFRVDAPDRAHDASTVPVAINQLDHGAQITSATVIIDENPAPVAATLGFSDAMTPIDFEMRVRVDRYSNIRVVAETRDGLFMNGRFVKASGGCSAPATGDPEAALASMGRMRLRTFDDGPVSTTRRQAQVMIRHPNYSGLQRDQITRLFVPAHFIDYLEVWQGEELLFTMDGGISISEDPVFRFSYRDNGAASFTVRATDTDGNLFESSLAKFAEG